MSTVFGDSLTSLRNGRKTIRWFLREWNLHMDIISTFRLASQNEKKNCVKNRTSNEKFQSNSFEARGKLVLCIHWHDYYCAIFRNMDFKCQTHTIFILFILNDRNIEWHVSCTIFYTRHFIDGFSDPAIPTESFTYAYQKLTVEHMLVAIVK